MGHSPGDEPLTLKRCHSYIKPLGTAVYLFSGLLGIRTNIVPNAQIAELCGVTKRVNERIQPY